MDKGQVDLLVATIKSYYPIIKLCEDAVELAIWRDELSKYEYDYCIDRVRKYCKYSDNMFDITLPNIIDVCEQGQAEYYKDCEIKKAEEYRKAHPTIPMSAEEKEYKELERIYTLKKGCLLGMKVLNNFSMTEVLEKELKEIKEKMEKIKI